MRLDRFFRARTLFGTALHQQLKAPSEGWRVLTTINVLHHRAGGGYKLRAQGQSARAQGVMQLSQ